MSVEDVFRMLLNAGITLRTEDDALLVDSTVGVMTDELRQVIREHKLELFDLLQSGGVPTEASASEPPVPEGKVGEHREPCPTCQTTWQWPTLSADTGVRGWTCATCHVASGKPIRIATTDGHEPIAVAPGEPAASPPGYETVHPQSGKRYTTTLYACPKCGAANWGPTGTVEPDGAERWGCLTCGPSQPAAEGMMPPAPISQPHAPHLDAIPERKGNKLLDIGSGADRHHPEMLELAKMPVQWTDSNGLPSRIHQHQCPLCGGAQLVETDISGRWYCGTCHSLRQLVIEGSA